MTPERRSRIAALFDEAVSSQPEMRERFVERLSSEDEALGQELRSLLSASDAAEQYFERVAVEAIGPALEAIAVAGDEFTPDEQASRLERAIGSTFRIERELGGGGMSRVFLATEVRLKRKVVIKILPEDMALGVSFDRFRREIQLSARLQHPHIVPVLSTDIADGLLYYAMPYVAGETLRSRVARDGPLPLVDALAVWRDVLDALAYAHSSGVVHRDIKPENILLTGRNALVVDFGIARAIEAAADEANVTASGVTLGTPAYMAPEQASGEGVVDHRIDIYAAGLVMYEMLAGQAPFAGLGARKVLIAHITQSPPPITRADVPARLASLVLRCLAKDPGERPSTAESILEEIDRTVGVDASVRKRPWTLFAVAAAAILLVSSVAIDRFMSRRDAQIRGVAVASVNESSSEAKPSLAVLPLEVLTADSVSEFLADMLTAALIDKFTETGDLRVVQGPSSFYFKGHRTGLHAIADSLHVQNVLTGTVHSEAGAFRVLLRLVRGSDESVRWTQMYKGQREGMFALEDSIEGSVGRKLLPSLGRTHRRQKTKPDPEAYELYRRGLYELEFRERAVNLRSAINYLTQAVSKAPDFAEAHAALANAYGLMATGNTSDFPYRVAVDSAHYFAERAIALDDSLPEAYEGRAFIRVLFDFDWAGADADTKRASDLTPYYKMLVVRVLLSQWRGDFKKAVADTRVALSTDPMSPNARNELVRALFFNGEYDAALANLDTLFSLAGEKKVPRAYLTLGEINLIRGRYAEAIASFNRLLEASPDAPAPRAFLALTYARAGDSTRAVRQLNDLLTRWRTGRSTAVYVAIAYAALDDYDKAFAWLDSAYNDRSLRPLLMSPTFTKLRRDPRWELLMRRIGLRT